VNRPRPADALIAAEELVLAARELRCALDENEHRALTRAVEEAVLRVRANLGLFDGILEA